MKTVRNSLSTLLLLILISGVTTNLQAQGRGHGKHDNPGRGHQKEKNRGHDHDKHDDKGRYDWDHRDSHRDYSSRNDRYYRHGHYVTYHHHHHGRPAWAPAYGHRYNTRYIYYRDHNVYYDCYRDVFITWTGRRWVVTTTIPRTIVHVDFGRTAVAGVDYWDDDFDFYLTKRRPSYISISASW
ncbi:MAG TPA: hypothetical protein VGK39_00575 [Cyclobacteriaceae bacterium]